MAIDFSFPPEIEQVRQQVRRFCAEVVRPAEAEIAANEGDRRILVAKVIEMRKADTGDAATARDMLDRAVKIDPGSAPALINMGNYWARQDRTDEAHAWFERAVAADPYNYIPQFNLGQQKLKRGQLRDGLQHVTQSVLLKPDFAQGYQVLAATYAQFDRAETAREYEALRDLFAP